jgi:hypothetical protein
MTNGHMERMAEAVAEGVREAGAEADIKRVPELVSEDAAKQSGYKLDQKAPIATVAELPFSERCHLQSGRIAADSDQARLSFLCCRMRTRIPPVGRPERLYKELTKCGKIRLASRC